MRSKLFFIALFTFSYFISLEKGNGQTVVMSNTTLTTCNTDLIFPATASDYPPNQNIVMTLTPATPGNKILLTFSQLQINEEGDYLMIYDGPNTSSPVLEVLSYMPNPNKIVATNPTGQLTLRFFSDGEFEASGFKAHVSCFDPTLPPAAPISLKGSSVSNKVTLNWVDNAIGAKGFRIQRSRSLNNGYKTIAFLYDEYANSYVDMAPEMNTFYYYKVAAFNDNGTTYGDPIQIKTGPAPTIMATGTVTTCNAVFLDQGGFGNYAPNLHLVTTFLPGTTGKRIQAEFQERDFGLEGASLRIFDGKDTLAPLIYGASRYESLNKIAATNAVGALTIKFTSNQTNSNPGWISFITCINFPPIAPTNLTLSADSLNRVNLSWKDNSSNESGFVIERAFAETPDSFYPLGTVSANTTTYIDNQVYPRNTYNYRVRSYSESGGQSAPSNVKTFSMPLIMDGGFYPACDVSFRDQGGFGKYPDNANNITTVYALRESEGYKLSIKFLSFDTEKNRDYLYIYDGESTSARLIGKYSGNTLPPVLTATNSRGAFTFKFTSNGSINKSGWEAVLTCVAPANLNSSSFREIEESTVEIADKVNVFPNPTFGSFKIQLPQFVKWTELNMFDSEGTKHAIKRGGIAEQELEIDAVGMKKGLYIIELIGNTQVIHKRVLIK